MRKLHRVAAVVGAALILGLLALGTVTVAGQPPPEPPPSPEPEPTPTITPQQIIDGVNQLIPHVSIIPPPLEVLLPCLLYTSPSPRDRQKSRMPSSA